MNIESIRRHKYTLANSFSIRVWPFFIFLSNLKCLSVWTAWHYSVINCRSTNDVEIVAHARTCRTFWLESFYFSLLMTSHASTWVLAHGMMMQSMHWNWVATNSGKNEFSVHLWTIFLWLNLNTGVCGQDILDEKWKKMVCSSSCSIFNGFPIPLLALLPMQ